jgi:hypothetical protein
VPGALPLLRAASPGAAAAGRGAAMGAARHVVLAAALLLAAALSGARAEAQGDACSRCVALLRGKSAPCAPAQAHP